MTEIGKKKKLSETEIELGKKMIESQINTDLNTVKYDDRFNAYLVSDIIPTKKYFEHRLDMTDASIVRLQVDMGKQFSDVGKQFEKIDKQFEKIDKRFEKTDESINCLRVDMDKKFEKMDTKFDAKFDKLYGILELRDIETRRMMTENSKENREFIKTLQLGMDTKIESNAKEQRSFTLKMFGLTVTAFTIGLALVKSGILG